MKLSRRQLLQLAAGAAALPAVSRIAWAQAQDFPARPVRIITHSAPGGSPVNDVIGGRVPMVIDGYPPLAGALQAGAITALAVGSTTRLSDFPDPRWEILLAPPVRVMERID
jgi:tripartite-type tricarboxylate transporter receptor subunit TctC